ncbi:MAG TPA: DNA polymerase III subunit gamma/tau [Vicinamibacterales bacterium]|nr:DNA polymerase III subunit gamma/tau [Vicinamibacterales bacterium]
MAYQVLARKWRPQRFDDVIGQRGVTQTLRNAIAAKRIAHSFVFSGPRGVGKTTTARILARGLSCVAGPTADPCGECEPCVEIAQGRDMDVIEIDAATNTGIDDVREVILDGLGIRPVRNRYKIFIIDEVHRLSKPAFDALLKSVEEPPAHVVFMMATTEIDKVPATIQSRSQVFELKLIGVRQIADQLRAICASEGIQIDEAAITLVARAGDGSMRDAQSALDQVIAFAGATIAADDVTTVLGLVRRDMLFDIADAVAEEDAAAVFALAAQAVETGYELRTVVRELARLTRDLLVVKIDPSRAADPEIAAESEAERIVTLAAKFSSEDLMRAFEVLTRAEYEVKGSAHPRYHVEMALLRWMHMRKLVPLTELIQGMAKSSSPPSRGIAAPPASAPRATAAAARQPAPASRPVQGTSATVKAVEARREAPKLAAPVAQPAAPAAGDLKHAFLEEVRKTKKFFYGTVVAQAQRIDVEGDKIVFVFSQQHRALRVQTDQTRAVLEEIASAVAGRRMSVISTEGAGAAAPPTPDTQAPDAGAAVDRKADLKQQALADSGVQAMLDVFAGEIRDVEER